MSPRAAGRTACAVGIKEGSKDGRLARQWDGRGSTQQPIVYFLCFSFSKATQSAHKWNKASWMASLRNRKGAIDLRQSQTSRLVKHSDRTKRNKPLSHCCFKRRDRFRPSTSEVTYCCEACTRSGCETSNQPHVWPYGTKRDRAKRQPHSPNTPPMSVDFSQQEWDPSQDSSAGQFVTHILTQSQYERTLEQTSKTLSLATEKLSDAGTPLRQDKPWLVCKSLSIEAAVQIDLCIIVYCSSPSSSSDCDDLSRACRSKKRQRRGKKQRGLTFWLGGIGT